ncbi:beta-lactamase class A [Aquimarina brevivitae]|uniref:beta-lactamase n=2 Tax=Aquimarina brevivitae TaxID=323412 RepID=A0A4Q7NXB1_9FLAO|nr:beta-lactamase class A [Aquimarina brevivitae]
MVILFITVLYQGIGQELPVKVDNGNAPLRSLLHVELQKKLEKVISNNPGWNSLAKKKKMAVGLVDLSDINNIKFARVNGNEMMYAASLPKIAVLLAAIDAIDKGELKETPEVKSDMYLMISKSNNQATTRMIDRIGYRRIERVLTSDKYNLYDEETGGGLWVGKRYAAGGPTHREPLKNLSHAATVTQVCRFYYLLFQGKLVNEKRSKQMLDIMKDPSLHHKFVSVMDQIAPKAKIFRKSGTWKTYHSDSMLVWGNADRKYILVALVDDSNGERIIRDLVKPIEKILNIN